MPRDSTQENRSAFKTKSPTEYPFVSVDKLSQIMHLAQKIKLILHLNSKG